MSWFYLFLSVLPILAVVFLLAYKEWPADTSGVVGWVITVVVAIVFFETSFGVAMRSSLAGIIASFPVSLMVATSILQIIYMESTGALRRIVISIKTIASSDKAVQVMIINVGFGTLLAAVGATPVSVLPPIMIALGYSTFVAVALPAIGFDALCTYALLGAPIVVFTDMTGTSLTEAGVVFARYLPVISTLIGFAMLWIIGGFKLVRQGFIPTIISGVVIGLTAFWVNKIGGTVLTGVFAGLATVIVMLLYLKILGKPVIDKSTLSEDEVEYAKSFSLLKALSPWIILIVASFFVNFYHPVFEYLFVKHPGSVSIIPGQAIKTRFFWNAYWWIFVSIILSFPFLKPSGRQISDSITKWIKRAPRPMLSAAVFFAIAFVLNNSGFTLTDGKWMLPDPHNNMIWILADTSVDVFKGWYPLTAAFLGLFGGFVSGSESSTIAMFAKYHKIASGILGVKAITVIAGTAIGGGLASVISPAKLQNAAATIDAMGIESKVIKTAFVVSFFITAVAAVMTLIWA
ncbi:MAG TPA: L-lactate permease [Desulfobacteria bacterium]|nr:L-lactate permease [Desulfobacteria bacterium]